MEDLRLEIALQKGMKAEIIDDRVYITFDPAITKKDLWTAQLEVWLSKKEDVQNLSSGYFRIIKNKLSFIKWR